MSKLTTFIKKEIIEPLQRRRTCKHTGETQPFCSQCGADLRAVTSYECRVCALTARHKVYPAESVPRFCTQCGAPRFTFSRTRKKRSKTIGPKDGNIK